MSLTEGARRIGGVTIWLSLDFARTAILFSSASQHVSNRWGAAMVESAPSLLRLVVGVLEDLGNLMNGWTHGEG